MRGRRNIRVKKQRGSILFMVAAGIVVFLGIAGLALDLGRLYTVKSEMQNATDAAALAGAWKLDGTATGINNAVTGAQAAANKYIFNSAPIALAPEQITFSTQRDSGYVSAATAAGNAANIKFVKAEKTVAMDLTLIKVIPGVGNTQNVGAYAVAGQSPPLNNICDGIIPLAPVPQDEGGGIENYIEGHYYTYRLAPNNDITSVGSGNYLILDFCDALAQQGIDCNHGGSTVRDLLSGDMQGCVALNTPICTKPGVAAGPVRQGLNDRFSRDTNQTEYTDTSATYVWRDQYTKASPPGNGSRVFIVPFVSTLPNVWSPFTNGKNCPVYVLNYGCFFMREQVPGGNGGDIKGEYIGECNVNGYFDPNAPPPPSVGLPSITKLVLYR